MSLNSLSTHTRESLWQGLSVGEQRIPTQVNSFAELARRLDNDANLDYLNLARPSVQAGLSDYLSSAQTPLRNRPDILESLQAQPLGARFLEALDNALTGQLNSEDIMYIQAFVHAVGISIQHDYDSDGIDGVYGKQTHEGLHQAIYKLAFEPDQTLAKLSTGQSRAESYVSDVQWNRAQQGAADSQYPFLEGPAPHYPGQPVRTAQNGKPVSQKNPAQTISYTSAAAQQRGQRSAQRALNIARKMGGSRSTGKCYNAVKQALSDHIRLTGVPAHGAAGQLARSSAYREVTGLSPAQLRNLPAGAVVVWGKTGASPYGHISVALGNGREASDYTGPQMTSLRGHTNFRVFMPK